VGGLKKAYLEITNVCNLSCSFCPGTRRTGGFISPENFRILAERLRPHTQYLYLHLMGEPLLHPRLPELLVIAGELDFKIMITTNGTLLPQRLELLCNSPCVHKVSVSLHSFEGNESHDTDLANYLENCIEAGKQISAAGKLYAMRLWNLDGETTKGANSSNTHILSKLEEHFPRPWKENPRGITLFPKIFLEWGEKFQWPDLSAAEGGESIFCYGLRDQIGVLWDGTVVPCCLDHEGDIPLGNLYEQSLDEILNSPRAKAMYDGFSCRKATEELCRKCGYAKRF